MTSILFCGDVSSNDGYSVLARNLIKYNPQFKFIVDPRYQRADIPSKLDSYDIVIHHNPAVFFRPLKNVKNILYTMWETSRASKQFLEKAKLADEVWVPTKWNSIAYQEIADEVPVKIVPYPVPFNDFSIQPKVKHDTYRFLFVGTWYARKAPDVMLEAYAEAFDKTDNVELWLKRTVWPNSKFLTLNALIKKYDVQAKVVDITTRYASMQELYNQCDCNILASRGEGFGAPNIESALCGLNLIVSNATAQKDIWQNITPNLVNGRWIDVGKSCDTEEGISGWNNPDSIWFDPCANHISHLMKKVVDQKVCYRDDLVKSTDFKAFERNIEEALT